MPEIRTSTLANGLPVYRIAVEGTRATTILVAFDAGARTERRGGERDGPLPRASRVQGRREVPDLPRRQRGGRAHRRRAQRLHQPRPRRLPHHRPRARRARGGRPAHRLRRAAAHRRRRARARARGRRAGDRPRQRPALDAGRASDRPGGVRRSPARAPGARAGRAPARHVHPRGHRRLPRPPLVAPARAPRSWSATSTASSDDGAVERAVRALPDAARRRMPFEPAPAARAPRARRASATPTSRTCACPTARRSIRPTRASAPRW